MKRIAVFLLCLILLISFFACSDAKPNAPEDAKQVEEKTTPKTEPEKIAAPAEDNSPKQTPVEAIPEEYFAPEPTPPKVTEEEAANGVRIKAVSQPDEAYGVSLTLPSNWDYQSARPFSGGVGIEIKPQGERIGGRVKVFCRDSFGACGTGLTCEDISFNGRPASMGTYDGSSEWDYIYIKGTKGCVIINETQGWFSDYEEELRQILSTVEFYCAN